MVLLYYTFFEVATVGVAFLDNMVVQINEESRKAHEDTHAALALCMCALLCDYRVLVCLSYYSVRRLVPFFVSLLFDMRPPFILCSQDCCSAYISMFLPGLSLTCRNI